MRGEMLVYDLERHVAHCLNATTIRVDLSRLVRPR